MAKVLRINLKVNKMDDEAASSSDWRNVNYTYIFYLEDAKRLGIVKLKKLRRTKTMPLDMSRTIFV